ncbi:MAG TPA: hypothetical protein VER96_35910 [Polyangiaceae bacterium]|nr:hypothetical protein [Polyangiaceae bacterium]
MASSETYTSDFDSVISREERERLDAERAEIAEMHAGDSSSVVPPRAEQRAVLLRSGTMWGLLYLPLLTVIVVLSYMMVNLRSGPGRIPGAGDRASPNAQPGDK